MEQENINVLPEIEWLRLENALLKARISELQKDIAVGEVFSRNGLDAETHIADVVNRTIRIREK